MCLLLRVAPSWEKEKELCVISGVDNRGEWIIRECYEAFSWKRHVVVSELSSSRRRGDYFFVFGREEFWGINDRECASGTGYIVGTVAKGRNRNISKFVFVSRIAGRFRAAMTREGAQQEFDGCVWSVTVKCNRTGASKRSAADNDESLEGDISSRWVTASFRLRLRSVSL